jgi:serine/threonine protein kinase
VKTLSEGAITLAAGTQLGPYEIISPLGVGGMGEVYRAKDARLNREVAIKVLPASFANDADRLRRFEQEARATSALNHPNILTVHDIGTHDGAPYIVSELLAGEELRAQLNEGALPVRQALDYAQQITQGLSAAHEKGITHRDLKPENLFVTHAGRIKILDFGLAKLKPQKPAGSEDSQSPTRMPQTDPGTVMGTVGYMSPEQVRGQDVDPRSDLFSFGAILYEMLTGKRAFQGESMAETMTAGEDPNAQTMRRFNGDEQLPAAAESVKHLYHKGRVVQGVIGSGEIWDSELDRIQRFHTQFATSVEEMETASAAQIADFFQIPFLGIRVLSNNITNGGKYDAKTGVACQEYVYDVVKAYIDTTLKH